MRSSYIFKSQDLNHDHKQCPCKSIHTTFSHFVRFYVTVQHKVAHNCNVEEKLNMIKIFLYQKEIFCNCSTHLCLSLLYTLYNHLWLQLQLQVLPALYIWRQDSSLLNSSNSDRLKRDPPFSVFSYLIV